MPRYVQCSDGERYRMHYVWRVPKVKLSDDQHEQRAIAYARYLMARDGIEEPAYFRKIKAEWSGVYSKTRLGAGGRPVRERRICAIVWGHDRDCFFKRKDGRRGAYTHTAFDTEFRFELPNWDFNPDPAVDLNAEQPALLAA